MIEEKVSPEVAEQEVSAWLDAKRISARKRADESYQRAIETLVDAVVCGAVVFEDDKTIKHELLFPIEGFAKTLSYKPRITIEAVNLRMKGVKDGNARVFATLSALTDVAVGVLQKMDTEDASIANAIAIFFL